ncbi:uncharacterized protein LOC120090789 [Benincasa hispida]|uniref:uncharacterized protein LOC120090789 n=1 Tax=Benincasa hispida TaxID=102211 RepID=UPI0019018956|nr:uncharacterized protein LOC120090789 [Benincasa hispida]
MNLKAVKWQIVHGVLARRVVVRIFFLALAVSTVPLLHILTGADFGVIPSVIFRDCAVKSGYVEAKDSRGSYLFQGHFLNPIWVPFAAMHCEDSMNLTTNVVAELMEKKLLNHTAKCLCVGEGSGSAVLALRDIGFSDVIGVGQHRFFSLRRKQLVYELDFKDGSFDFVFSRDLDRYSVPALLVLEIERVLRPGGIGAVIVATSGSMPNNLIRAATPVSSLLKTSTVMHVGHVNNLTLVVFKKKLEEFRHLEPHISSECRSLTRNKPLIPKIEPFVKGKPVEFDKKLSYLPKLVDVSNGEKLVYVNIGPGKRMNHTNTDWFPPSYPVDRRDFNVYFVDHDMSALATYIHNPGVTFVYHPGLAGTDQTTENDGAADDEDEEPYIDDEFDFLSWFKETVQHSDFVVLKMDAGKEELKFLSDLFESGVICWVDEVFLSCRDEVDEEDGELKNRGCVDLYKDLRNSGVYVHQWFLDAAPSKKI